MTTDTVEEGEAQAEDTIAALLAAEDPPLIEVPDMDEDGYIYIVDRKKDLIIRGAIMSIRARSKRCCTPTRTFQRRQLLR